MRRSSRDIISQISDIACAKPLPGEFKLVMGEQWSEPRTSEEDSIISGLSFITCRLLCVPFGRPPPLIPTSLHQVLFILTSSHPAPKP